MSVNDGAEILSEPQRGGIVAAKVYAAPTELAAPVGWLGRYKDIAPTELCVPWFVPEA